MFKRTVVTFLWFYSMWVAGAIAAYFGNLPSELGPILAVATAAFVAIDPRGLFWSKAANPNKAVAARLATMTSPGGAR